MGGVRRGFKTYEAAEKVRKELEEQGYLTEIRETIYDFAVLYGHEKTVRDGIIFYK